MAVYQQADPTIPKHDQHVVDSWWFCCILKSKSVNAVLLRQTGRQRPAKNRLQIFFPRSRYRMDLLFVIFLLF